jgi:hypothetical protein
MRTWLYNRIKGITALPAGFKADNKIIMSGSADNPAPPFAIIQMGVEQGVLGMPDSARTQEIPFTVWLHDKPGSFLNIDNAAVALKDGLPTPLGAVVGAMSVFECKWEVTGEDAYDDHYSTSTRPVRFKLTTHR